MKLEIQLVTKVIWMFWYVIASTLADSGFFKNFLYQGGVNTVAVWQCWTVGRSSTAVAEDFIPTATATVAEV